MKFVIVVALSVVCLAKGFNIPDEVKEIVEEAHQTCKQETGVTEESLRHLLKSQFDDDMKLKCFLKCMMQRLQAMREDGTVDVDLIEVTLPDRVKEKGTMDALRKCLPPKDGELCQAAFDILVCMHRVNPDLSKIFE